MYKKLIWLLLAFALAAHANTADFQAQQLPTLKPMQQQALAVQLTARLIEDHHYKPVPLNDSLSEKIFDAYLKALDPEKLFFVSADIDRWKNARTQLDDSVLTENLSLPFDMFNLYAKRAVERFTYARSLLKAGFDFKQNESYQYNREKDPWAQSEEEIRELWRKRVKNDWLQLKLTGKDDKKIAELLDKRYQNFLKRMAKLKSEDAFQTFMNAYTISVDPHTNYMGPRSREDFDISLRLSLVGIGAVLEQKDDYATIKELVPGSPAALSEKLKPGDRIVGVAQGEKGAMADVVGWRLDDTVALIRGKEDTVVVLDIMPSDTGPDSEHKLVKLIRKKIKLEDQAAKKSVITLSDNGTDRRIGVISLPTFYEDFQARQKGDEDYKSATRDVAKLLSELKAEKVDAVLMDLRNNGGGSLTEAIELTGLFVGSGPVVQQRDGHGDITVSRSVTPGVAWDGPLGVLINRASASASEIFAAAIQDYKRGLIIGETSFGKGTVQTVVDLDQFAQTENHQLGDLKLTIAQFFRINGGTTQLRGVTPDINLPITSDPEHFGESSYDNGLPWMQIKAANYRQVGELRDVLPIIQQRHDQRVATDKDYQNLLEDIAEFDKRRKANEISLNEAERRKEREELKSKLKSRENSKEEKDSQKTETTASEEDRDDADDEEMYKKQGKKDKDALLREAAYIVADSVELVKKRINLASRVQVNPLRASRNRLAQ